MLREFFGFLTFYITVEILFGIPPFFSWDNLLLVTGFAVGVVIIKSADW